MGKGFSVEVCQAWEAVLFEAPLPLTRRVAMRLSMVFGRPAPVFQVFARLAKLGLGGQQGDGGQYVSWLHEKDFVRAVEFLLEHTELSGTVNVCGPAPLPNRDFMRAVRKAFGVPFGLPGPRLALEVGAIFLRTETELILKSRRVVPRRLLDAGFEFEFNTWPAAVQDVVGGARQ
jgi:NAD dependent epimerase/dehydratase family enzyme